jgi:hypothetical protein
MIDWIKRGETFQVGMAIEYALEAFEAMTWEPANGRAEGVCDYQEKGLETNEAIHSE